MKWVFEQDMKIFTLKLNRYKSNFHPLEIVGYSRKTQPREGENLKYFT